jgi:hypothetical protein
MADDDRSDERDPEVAAWLAVDPLDEVTRRRLVSTALREGAPAAPARPTSRAWRWIAAAAAVVVLGVGALAIVTADGGNDATTASRAPSSEGVAVAPKAGATLSVGDLGDLADPANLARLRDRTAAADSSAAAAPNPAFSEGGDVQHETRASTACSDQLPDGTVLATGTGTLDGRPAVAVLLERPDGKQEIDAVLTDSCELRRLS